MRIIVEDVPAEARTFVFTSPNLRIYGDFRVADVADPEATILHIIPGKSRLRKCSGSWRKK